MSRYAAWIEPALINEWIDLMQNYQGTSRRTYDEHLALLLSLDPEHVTRLIRTIASNIRDRGGKLYCI